MDIPKIYDIIFNLQPLNIYELKYDVCNDYDKITMIKKMLDNNPSITKLTNFIKYNNKGDIFYILLNIIQFISLLLFLYLNLIINILLNNV